MYIGITQNKNTVNEINIHVKYIGIYIVCYRYAIQIQRTTINNHHKI